MIIDLCFLCIWFVLKYCCSKKKKKQKKKTIHENAGKNEKYMFDSQAIIQMTAFFGIIISTNGFKI